MLRRWRTAARAAVPIAILAALVSCARDVPMKPLRQALVIGTIRDGAGNGAPDVNVTFTVHSGPYVVSGGLTAETDSAGNYQLIAPEGEYFPELLSLEDRFPHATLGPVRVRAPSTRFDYRYAGHRVSGVITAPGGSPLDSGLVVIETVHAKTYDEYLYLRIPVLGGGYEAYLPTGTYSFWFDSRHATDDFAQNFLPVSIVADTTWNVSLDGYRITGTVTLGAGTPMIGASVQGSAAQAYARTQTDAAGNYSFVLPAGDYDWSASPGPANANCYRVSQSGPGISGPSVINFDLTGVRWSGVVRMSPLNAPVAGAHVFVNKNFVYPDVVSSTDVTGSFELHVQPSRRYSVRAEAPGAGAWTAEGVLAGNDSTFDIILSPATP